MVGETDKILLSHSNHKGGVLIMFNQSSQGAIGETKIIIITFKVKVDLIHNKLDKLYGLQAIITINHLKILTTLIITSQIQIILVINNNKHSNYQELICKRKDQTMRLILMVIHQMITTLIHIQLLMIMRIKQ
jgi:hypothetical protein